MAQKQKEIEMQMKVNLDAKKREAVTISGL